MSIVNNSVSDGLLPYEYQKLDYIESTGEQFINTNYVPAEGDDLVIENVKCRRTSQYQSIFSAGTGTHQLILLLHTQQGFFKYFATGAAAVVSLKNTNILTDFATIKVEDGDMSFNNILVATSVYGGEANTSLYLFKRADDSSYATATIGRVTITNNKSTKLDLIPCYRKSDDVVGMYDIVGNKFYTSEGAAEFLKGVIV